MIKIFPCQHYHFVNRNHFLQPPTNTSIYGNIVYRHPSGKVSITWNIIFINTYQDYITIIAPITVTDISKVLNSISIQKKDFSDQSNNGNKQKKPILEMIRKNQEEVVSTTQILQHLEMLLLRV